MLYNIWNARNEKEFKGKNIPPAEAMQRAMKALNDYQANQKSRAMQDPTGNENNRNNTSWSLPPKGTLKLNVDAHLLSDGRWGLGLLLRRDDGSTIGAVTRTRLGSNCALLAEAMGLQEAINLVQQWDLSNVIIKMDAKSIVDTVNSRCCPRTNWGMIVDRCVRKMKNRTGIEVKWTRRQGNTAAHELAKWARYEPNKNWVSNYPTCITDQVQKDMVSISHNQ
jgi:ribonuclease HI